MSFTLPGTARLSDIRDAASGGAVLVSDQPVAIYVPQETLDRINSGDAPDEAQAMANLQTAFGGAEVLGLDTPQATALGDAYFPLPEGGVCDTCSAAKLAEDGVMPTSVSSDELHSRCRQPGACTCGCSWSRGGRCSNCGRNQPFDALQSADGSRVECVDRAACAKAMLDRQVAPPTANGSKKAASARKEGTKTPPTPRAPRTRAEPRQCLDGCGETTGGGMYKPGHDSRHVKTLVAAVRAGGLTRGAAREQLPSEALRDKLDKQLGG